MHQVSRIAFAVALLASPLLQPAPAGAQSALNRPLLEWVSRAGQAGAIQGEVAQALGLGNGEDIATAALIFRDTTGLQYSLHVVKDRPDLLILIRATPDIADSWKIIASGSVERSVHVDEKDKVSIYRFQPRLFDEALQFFQARAEAAKREALANPAAAPAEPAAAAPQRPAGKAPPAVGVPGLIQRGTQYNLAGDYERAIADFNEAIRLAPNSAQSYYGRAAVYYNLGDYDRSIADYDQVLRLEPRNNMAATFKSMANDMKNKR